MTSLMPPSSLLSHLGSACVLVTVFFSHFPWQLGANHVLCWFPILIVVGNQTWSIHRMIMIYTYPSLTYEPGLPLSFFVAAVTVYHLPIPVSPTFRCQGCQGSSFQGAPSISKDCVTCWVVLTTVVAGQLLYTTTKIPQSHDKVT